jgi:alpha/beta superfamily hydrolase
VPDELTRLRTSDGVELAADLAPADEPWAGAVVCHPHPAYGGDRRHPVVERTFRALAGARVTALRFDFRQAGGDGTGERLDVLAALDRVAAQVGPAVPLWLVGYSFGADVALSVDDGRVAGWVAVAPPLHVGGPPVPAGGDPRPALVVAAEHDQFSPPGRLRDATADWADAAVAVVPDADHFLAGAAGQVADHALTWLRRRSRGSPLPRPNGA